MSNPNYNAIISQEGKFSLSTYDHTLLFIVLFLIIIGFLAIFSAAIPKTISYGVNSTYFVGKQLAGFLIGFALMMACSHMPYKKLDKYAIPFAWLIVGLLVAVHLWGDTTNGATRWLNIGPVKFQPSEAAKLSVILLLASAFSKSINIFSTKFLKYLIPILIMLGLIFKQPNLSMILILLICGLFMYFAAGGSLKVIGFFCGLGLFLLNILIQSFQRERIMIWLNPNSDPYGAGYNIIQAMIAFVAGGFIGEGYGNSRQKLGWLPEGHTDFIFAVWGEEFGFIGCLLVVGLFLAFLQRGLLISAKCEDIFGKLLSAGITVAITIQALINIAVSSSMIPATGVPLPFVSYGGTSLIITMLMIGILLNVSKKRIRKFPNVQ